VTKGARIHGWRKIAASTWHAPSDPQIYADLDIDASAMLGYVEAVRRRTGVKLTVTHLVAKAVAHTFTLSPDLNGRLHRGRFVPRDRVSVFVSLGGCTDRGAVTVRDADTKSVVDIAREVQPAAVADTRRPLIQADRAGRLLNRLPPALLRVGLRAAACTATDLDLHLTTAERERHPFGSAMVITADMFGVERTYAPLSPYYQVPFMVLVGEVAMRPVAVEARIIARPMVTLTVTLDHRYVDGFHAARVISGIRQYCQHPQAFESPLGAAEAIVTARTTARTTAGTTAGTAGSTSGGSSVRLPTRTPAGAPTGGREPVSAAGGTPPSPST